ncbi:MAG: nucleotidyltransferase family protein [Chloroflexota bacterium]
MYDLGAELTIQQAVVLAAGEGTRLRPLTLRCPKALVEIAGVPLLDHSLTLLAQHGVRHVAINLHYLPEKIVEFVGDGSAWGLAIQYLHEQPALLGSGGTLRALAPLLRAPFFLLYGDVLTNADLSGLARQHAARRAALTCLLHRVPDPWNKGVADLAPDGRIRRFVEKPPRGEEPGDLAAAGIYVVDPALLAVIPVTPPCDFGADVVPAALAAGLTIYGESAPSDTYICDIGTHEALAQAQADVAAGRVGMLHR